MQPTIVESVPSVVDEFVGAPLGNTARNRRLDQVVEAVCRGPDESFPRIFSTSAELEGFYRFINGGQYGAADILEPHAQLTAERIRAEQVAIVAHDTSEMEFKGEAERRGLGRLRDSAKGFLLHASLAVSAGAIPMPLGALSTRTWARTGPPKGKRNGATCAQAEDKESARWLDAVLECEARVQGSLIHVMDREADAYALLAQMSERSIRFVVRLARDRVAGAEVVVGARDRVRDLLEIAPVVAEREVPIARRTKETAPSAQRRHAERAARVAHLSIRAQAMVLKRPFYLTDPHPVWLPIHVVHVVEVDVPEGQTPVEWVLLTQQPIETAEQVLAVVDAYRARWMIEEYFRALKVGCAVEKRQLESYDALCKAVAIFVPIAWKLLELRQLSRTEPDAPATRVLTATQIEILKACGRVSVKGRLTVGQALMAIAAMGGHIKNNGAPGWQVIGRGFEELLKLEMGWVAAQRAMRGARRR